jgi:hypothetical protein
MNGFGQDDLANLLQRAFYILCPLHRYGDMWSSLPGEARAIHGSPRLEETSIILILLLYTILKSVKL